MKRPRNRLFRTTADTKNRFTHADLSRTRRVRSLELMEAGRGAKALTDTWDNRMTKRVQHQRLETMESNMTGILHRVARRKSMTFSQRFFAVHFQLWLHDIKAEINFTDNVHY